tara:strand:+ start:419 stop:1270 length:852 start_codon:yes stop_codon:yes gene_type:complete
MNDFAIFIMVHGRPDKFWTYRSLKNQGYTGKIFLVADDLDETRFEYQKIYRDELLIFDKKKAALNMDAGDNTDDLRSTLFSANTIFKLAKDRGIKYFFIMCDDYTGFYHNFTEQEGKYRFKKTRIKSLDKIFAGMLEFYKKTPITTLAMAQGGDFMGGENSTNATIKLKRKAMNSFLCSTERPFKFIGRLNEDATTYVNLGSKGTLFATMTNVMLVQTAHQQEKSGLTDVYLDYGTYVKSFMSVMYNPSCIKVSSMGVKNFRMHHQIKWNNAVPKILNEKNKK